MPVSIFAISSEESRYTLNGALMLLKPESITMVATDGHRLAHCERSGEKFEGVSGEMKTLVPKKAMDELKSLLDSTDSETVEFAKDESTLFFRIGGRLLTSRQLTGQFPNYEAVLPRENNKFVSVHCDELSAAIQRVAQFADERSNAIRMRVEKNELKVSSSNTETGESEDSIEVAYTGDAMVIGFKTLPATPRAKHAFDFPGALLAAGSLGLFIIGIGGAAHGAQPVLVAISLIGAALLGFILTRRHADHPAPMLPIDLFRRALFALSAATAVCSFAVQGLAFVSLPFYFEDVLHRSQVETGFFMTPWPLVVAIMAPIGGRLSDRFSAGVLGGLGLLLLGVGMVLLATLPAVPGIANIVWRMAVCGIGFGLFQTPNMKAIMSSAPPHRSGSASGIVATARLIGQTTGAALAALCFGLAGRDGAALALALGAGFAALGCVMSFLRLTVSSQRKA